VKPDGRERKSLIATAGVWANGSVDSMVWVHLTPTLLFLRGLPGIAASRTTTATVIYPAFGD
jgi:hypothetical protein